MTGTKSIYTDRFGKEHRPQSGSVIRPRRGVFGICIFEGKILLSWPKNSPDVPELPGGGIEDGEGLEDALVREMNEEAAVSLDMQHPPRARVTKTVRFYAEFDNEFWDYAQSYLRLDERDAAAIYFDGQRSPEDALKSGWVALDELENITLHAMHAKALEEFL